MTTPVDVKSEIDSRKNRWNEFLKPDAEPGFLFRLLYPKDSLPPAPPHWPDKARERIEYKWQAYRHDLEHAREVDDDSVPFINMCTGTEIFAEAFGCPVHRPADNMPFALPRIRSASEVAAVQVPELSTSSLAYLFDMADELTRRAGPGAVFKMVDIQSPLDIAALIWEKESLFVAMIEAPEAVKELSSKTAALLTAFLDEWFRRYGKEHVAHCPDYFMASGMTLSEDEIGSMNADMFREFVYPELVALSTRYGGLGMHCCADARHQWENLKTIPDLKLLNFCNPPTRTPETYIGEALSFFAETCAQYHCGWSPALPAERWPEAYPRNGRYVIEAWSPDKVSAIALAKKLREAQ
jgi:hypothetical protein